MKPAALEWVARFLQYIRSERRLSAHTDSNYARDLAALVKYCDRSGLEDWTALDNQHIRVFAAHSHAGGLSPRSVQRRLSAVRSFYEFLIRENHERPDAVRPRALARWRRRTVIHRNPRRTRRARTEGCQTSARDARPRPDGTTARYPGGRRAGRPAAGAPGVRPARPRHHGAALFLRPAMLAELVGLDVREHRFAAGRRHGSGVLGKGNKTRICAGRQRVAVEVLKKSAAGSAQPWPSF